MIIRRLRQHIQNQNWFAVIVDLVIVMVGVYLGLQAQNWSQAQKDKQKAEFFTENLVADFTVVKGELETCLQTNESGIEAVDYINGLVAQGADESLIRDNRVKIGHSLLLMSGGNLPPGRATSFVEMQSSGELQLIKNASLRRALTAYDQMAQAHRETWRSLRNETGRYLSPLYAYVDVTVKMQGALTSRINEFDLASLASDTGFQAMINAVKGAKANEHELCKRQHRQVEKVLNLLAD